MREPNLLKKIEGRQNFGPKSDLQAFDPLKIVKIDLKSQMEKLYSENWSGWAFYHKILYESLTF